MASPLAMARERARAWSLKREHETYSNDTGILSH
jgi:hypothetical protein